MSTIWTDKKHHLWWKISFTRYKVTENKLYMSRGLIRTHYEEIFLYRIVDCSCTRGLLHKVFGTGNVCLISTDKTTPELLLQNIKNPLEISELISSLALKARQQNKMLELV